MELIKLHDIYKTYHLGEIDVPVLKGVSLAVERGELVALMGASGSGKSTLMNILGCLDRPTSGEYWLDGEEIAELSSDERAHVRNRKIGFVFQSFNLLARTTALENVMMPLTYAARAVSEREAPRARDRAARARRPRRPHAPLPVAALRRPAAARRHRPGADQPPAAAVRRRAHRQPRLPHQRGGARDVPAAEPRGGITIILVTHDVTWPSTPTARSGSATG